MTTNAFRCLGCNKRCEASYYELDKRGNLYKGGAIDHICEETGEFTDWCLLPEVDEVDCPRCGGIAEFIHEPGRTFGQIYCKKCEEGKE